MEVMAQKQVPVEMCITSNLRTGACKKLQEHPVKKFFDQGLMITLSTDDPAMFQTSLNKEFEIAQQEFNFSEEHLRELARNSIEASFLPVEK
jgi:aminodeoxyfutalosine deaminase